MSGDGSVTMCFTVKPNGDISMSLDEGDGPKVKTFTDDRLIVYVASLLTLVVDVTAKHPFDAVKG